MKAIITALALICGFTLPAAAAEVIVLGTMHQLHAEMPYYTFEDLRRLIVRLDPDVLCVELQPGDLKARPEEKNKREYPQAIYPLIDTGEYKVHPMEPADPLFTDILAPLREAQTAFRNDTPQRAATLDAYIEGVYALLREYWRTPAMVNDAFTDLVFEAKHAAQAEMIGAAEAAGWEAWNEHFLSVIRRAAKENPDARIVATVGAEHGYWLRKKLRNEPGIRLLEGDEVFGAADE